MWNPFAVFGSAKKAGDIAEKVTVGIMDGIDAAWYTDEEKAADAQERRGSWLKMMEATAGENSIRSVTRRILAFLVIGPFMGLLICAAGLYKFDLKWAEFILSLLTEISNIVLGIVLFYFGPYEVGKLNFFKNKKRE